MNPSSQEPAQSLPTKPTAVTEDAVAKPSELTSGTPAVTGIRHWVQDGTTTVAIDLQSEVQYETHRLENPDRIYFDLHDTALAPSLTNRSIPIDDSLVSKIRVAQPTGGVTRVVLDTKAVANFSVRMEENPYRLMIEVRTKSEQVAPIPAKQGDIIAFPAGKS